MTSRRTSGSGTGWRAPTSLVRRAARVVARHRGHGAPGARALRGGACPWSGAGPGDPGPPAGRRRWPAVRTRFGLPERYFLFVGGARAAQGARPAGRRPFPLGCSTPRSLSPARAGSRPAVRGSTSSGASIPAPTRRRCTPARWPSCCPSWIEGYGYPPLEGFAHGTPAIVSDLPALRETAGAGARYVPAGDVPGLAAALRELAGDDELRRRLARRRRGAPRAVVGGERAPSGRRSSAAAARLPDDGGKRGRGAGSR